MGFWELANNHPQMVLCVVIVFVWGAVHLVKAWKGIG